ncbi:DUF4123 domain-containing protein [Erwinia sp.]|uniref:DUF4123 domain-containing protein n=1 Tax=Erwinia citreus TaxID=558 RepID=UPI003C71E1BC
MNSSSINSYDAIRWLAQCESLCSAAEIGHIDVIIDRAAVELVSGALRRITPPLQWGSLSEGTAEEESLEEGPIVVRFSWSTWQHKSLLSELMHQYSDDHRLMLIISPLSFTLLKEHLSNLTQLQWRDQSGILRFNDPRVFPELLEHVLTVTQQELFTRLAFFWGWLDRDLHYVWKRGTYSPQGAGMDRGEIIKLDDGQIERIGCISDAEMLARTMPNKGLSHEQKFGLCFSAALSASQEGDAKSD